MDRVAQAHGCFHSSPRLTRLPAQPTWNPHNSFTDTVPALNTDTCTSSFAISEGKVKTFYSQGALFAVLQKQPAGA